MDQSTILTKICTKCGQEKPLTAFHKDRECRLGCKNRCKACDRLYEAMRYALPEVRERKLERLRNAYAQDPDHYRAKNNAWFKAHPETLHEGQKRWRGRRSDDAWLAARERTRRNMFFKQTGIVAEPVSYRAILDRDGFFCHICKQPIEPAVIRNLHFDHIVPPDKGGTHTAGNIAVAHVGCNIRKRNRLDDAAI